jgi:hypothetical protein
LFLVLALCTTISAQGREEQEAAPLTTSLGLGGAVAYQTAAGQADLATAKSLLNSSILKGEVGESIRDQTVGRYLHRSGQWLNASPRIGRQGLDHVSVQLDENGTPRRLMVDETKYGSSTLLTTKSGDIQMGKKWIADRLHGMAGRYEKISAVVGKGISRSKAPPGVAAKQMLSIPLSDTESVVFWRSGGEWNYDGPSELLPRAGRQLDNLARLYRAGAEGRIEFPKRIFHVKFDGDIMKLTIRDASNVDSLKGALDRMPVKYKVALPIEKATWASAAMREKIAADIRSQNPHLSDAESMRQAKGIQSIAKTAESALMPDSFALFSVKQATRSAAFGVVIAVPIDLAFQLIGPGDVDWSRVAGTAGLAGGSAFAGSLAGNAVTYVLLRTGAATEAANILGLNSAGLFANTAGGAFGGGTAAALFSYGGYWMGYYDLKTANRSAVAGTTGAGVGAAASAATLGLVAAYGTAGTGAAISSLGGAAATSASLSWIGGGTVASGGLGVAGGTVILSTGVGIIILGTTAAVLYGFQVYDEHQDCIRLSKTIDYLDQKQTFFLSAREIPAAGV